MDTAEIVVAVVVPVSMILIILFLYKDPVIYFFRRLFTDFEEKLDISPPKETQSQETTVIKRKSGRIPILY